MEHRSQKTSRFVGLVAAVLALVPAGAAELTYQVRHDRPLHDHRRIFKTKVSEGVLTINDQGVGYQQVIPEEKRKKNPKKPPKLVSFRFDYQDIQELWVSPDKLVVVTYKDRKWLLGIDKEFEFFLPKGKSFEDAFAVLKDKLDRRFVAAMADPQPNALWELPVKLLGTIKGSEGLLQVGSDRIVYKTDSPRQSRTWRYQDIENVSTSDRYQLTLTTYERAKTHYGSMKGFNFQLKQPLDEKRFDSLWKRLNKDNGLQYLTSIEERNTSK
ncbi:MAG: hypothetical protein HS123_11045 [Solibacteraceae bacterium]|nr:hypothetical protein [Solibacteraceae bacterium]